jgi:hypothetical protein
MILSRAPPKSTRAEGRFFMSDAVIFCEQGD